MSIIGLSQTASLSQGYVVPNPNAAGHLSKGLNAIGTALQSGDVSAAQTALATFQQGLASNSQTSSSQPFGNYSQANLEYERLVSDVQSGNVSDAQKAFANLLTALPRLKVAMLG